MQSSQCYGQGCVTDFSPRPASTDGEAANPGPGAVIARYHSSESLFRRVTDAFSAPVIPDEDTVMSHFDSTIAALAEQHAMLNRELYAGIAGEGQWQHWQFYCGNWWIFNHSDRWHLPRVVIGSGSHLLGSVFDGEGGGRSDTEGADAFTGIISGISVTLCCRVDGVSLIRHLEDLLRNVTRSCLSTIMWHWQIIASGPIDVDDYPALLGCNNILWGRHRCSLVLWTEHHAWLFAGWQTACLALPWCEPSTTSRPSSVTRYPPRLAATTEEEQLFAHDEEAIAHLDELHAPLIDPLDEYDDLANVSSSSSAHGSDSPLTPSLRRRKRRRRGWS